MSSTIDFDEQSGWVILTHWGETPISELEQARDTANKMLAEHNSHMLLVDATGVTKALSTVDYYTFASEIPSTLPARIRMALIAPVELARDGRFLENVLVNR